MKLLYKEEVLILVGCSRPTLDREVKNGALAPGRIINGRVAWLESDIDKYLEALPPQRFTGRPGRPKLQDSA